MIDCALKKAASSGADFFLLEWGWLGAIGLINWIGQGRV